MEVTFTEAQTSEFHNAVNLWKSETHAECEEADRAYLHDLMRGRGLNDFAIQMIQGHPRSLAAASRYLQSEVESLSSVTFSDDPDVLDMAVRIAGCLCALSALRKLIDRRDLKGVLDWVGEAHYFALFELEIDERFTTVSEIFSREQAKLDGYGCYLAWHQDLPLLLKRKLGNPTFEEPEAIPLKHGKEIFLKALHHLLDH
jgi:hypothetical protein